jgi:AraC-like DNA-binding protein
MTRLDCVANWPLHARKARYNSIKLAALCSVSSSSLQRYFIRVFGRSTQEWLNELRLWHCMKELWKGDQIKRVALEFGFCDSAHFCKRFKEYHGCTPTEFLDIEQSRAHRLVIRYGRYRSSAIWIQAERALCAKLRLQSVSVKYNLRIQDTMFAVNQQRQSIECELTM